MKMDSYTAVSIAEGFCDFTPTAWQELQAWEDGLISKDGKITAKGRQYREL